jgi:hypothetical protein
MAQTPETSLLDGTAHNLPYEHIVQTDCQDAKVLVHEGVRSELWENLRLKASSLGMFEE